MSERVPLAPITQLKRDAIPGPPARRPASDGSRVESPATPAPEQARPRPAVRAAKRVGETTPTDMRPISLSVPAPLLESFKLFAKRTDTSQASVLMDAITAHHDHLVDLVTTSRPGPNNDGLFVRDTPRDTIPLSTLSLRMRAVNIDAIDQLVEASAATSRSHLCVAVLTAYLSTNR